MSSRYYQKESRYRGPKRNDVKTSTMSRLVKLDEDVASRYEFEEDEPYSRQTMPRPRPTATASPRGQDAYGPARKFLATSSRQDKQLMMQRTNRRELVCQFKVLGVAVSEFPYVLKNVTSAIPGLKPICPRINCDGDLEFYTYDSEHASALKAMGRRIHDRKNRKLAITFKKTLAIWDPVSNEVKKLIQEVLNERFNNESNSLDLTEFGTDKKFLSAKKMCGLLNNSVMVYVTELIDKEYSFITGLSLKGNRLKTLNCAMTLVFCAPKVKELDLSNNLITKMEELEKFKLWPIEKLHLENNDFCHKYSHDATAYARDVHAIFPRVDYLDGISVARSQFVFPDEQEVLHMSNLPSFKICFTPDDGMLSLIETFLAEYFGLYDGSEGAVTRQQLYAAYDANATFTYSYIDRLDTGEFQKSRDNYRGDYRLNSHNVMTSITWEHKREHMIYRGPMDIVNRISKLPITKHLYETFSVDIPMVSPELMCFTLQGLLRDGSDAFSEKSHDDNVKFFIRSFMVLPRPENKIAILNDMISLVPISMVRYHQYKRLFDKIKEDERRNKLEPSRLQSAINATDAIGQMTIATPSAYDKNDPAIQQAMIEQFSQQSGMKPEWSRRCLEDQHWDFESAGRAFLELRETIPSEAFI